MTTSGSHHVGRLLAASEHVKKYLVLYIALSVAFAVPTGFYSQHLVAANKGIFSNLVIILAVLTVFPSMVQLKTEGLASSFKQWKPILVSVAYVFLLFPLLAFALAPTLGNKDISMGFVVANVVPASSSSLGYVLIAGGSIELATAIGLVSLVLAIPAIPFFLSLYGSQVSSTVPISPIMMAILYALIIPLVAGQLTRYPLLKRRGANFVNKSLKPYLSLATMLSMFALAFVLVMRTSNLIVSEPLTVGYVIAYQSAIITGVLALSVFVSRAMKLSYENHQALALISVPKNQSVAATIATLALNPVSVLVPAIIPVVQPVLAIIYINLEKPVRRLLLQPSGSSLRTTPLEREEIAPKSVSNSNSDGATKTTGSVSLKAPERSLQPQAA